MTLIALTSLDLAIAAGLVLMLAVLSWFMHLGIERTLIIAAVRTVVQLLLVGLVLKILFQTAQLGWTVVVAVVMLLFAGREVMARQTYRLKGWWGYGVGTSSMFISTFSITVLVLILIVNVKPWYMPQYSITLLGMMLGNTMNGIALAMDRLMHSAWQQRQAIEAKLLLGYTGSEAVADIRHESMRTGMIPMINAMAAAGLVSLPGMMTGQILSGTPPMEAVKYQILIMFMITAGTGFGTLAAVWISTRRLFDDRHRLRLERLRR
jgi:UDP-glucose/iron transport system permease protein